MMLTFKEFVESKDKTIVFTFGRFNPITTGHDKLVNLIAQNARGVEGRIYMSQTHDKKRNPLTFPEKLKFAKKAFKGVKISTDTSIRTPFDALELFSKEGFKNVIMVVGQDQVVAFQTKVAPFIKNPAKKPNLDFNFSVISAGERDPDADGPEGASASKMREYASLGDIEAFARGAANGLSISDKKALFRAVRQGMGLN